MSYVQRVLVRIHCTAILPVFHSLSPRPPWASDNTANIGIARGADRYDITVVTVAVVRRKYVRVSVYQILTLSFRHCYLPLCSSFACVQFTNAAPI